MVEILMIRFGRDSELEHKQESKSEVKKTILAKRCSVQIVKQSATNGSAKSVEAIGEPQQIQSPAHDLYSRWEHFQKFRR